jgi:hypothetical protein
MTEDEAWDLLEKKQQKKPKLVTEREALRIAYNALIEIDKETPYPLAKHAAMVINSVLNVSQTDWEAIAADQALTIAMLQRDIEHSLVRIANALDIAERAYFAGKKDGAEETLAQSKPWDTSDMAHRPNGLSIDDDIQEYKKPLVGLTDEEIAACNRQSYDAQIGLLPSTFYRAIKTKLKERNNG